MAKDMVAVLSRQLKSYKPKKQPAKPHLGFANGYEDQIFRALAAVHPKGVAISEACWRGGDALMLKRPRMITGSRRNQAYNTASGDEASVRRSERHGRTGCPAMNTDLCDLFSTDRKSRLFSVNCESRPRQESC